jgi:hypothetical protein
MMFRILWGVDAVVFVLFFCFFFIGLADGSVSSFNMGLWLFVLATIAALLWGSHALRIASRETLAATLLGILAVPGVLFGLFILAVLILNPRWN